MFCRALRTFIDWGQMALQIHGVMKEAQDLDHVAVGCPSDAEHDEMKPLAGLAGDVQCENSLQNVVPLFCTDDGRAGSQIIQRRGNCSSVAASLRFAELVHRPAQYFLEAGLGGRRQSNRPATRPCAHFARVAGFPPITLSAMAVK